MPERTLEERERIDNLPIKASDTKCNARTPAGTYCRMVAGFKTDHPGDGRCYLHGGRSDGRPIKLGIYSKKLKKTIAEDYELIVTDPAFMDLHSELAITKTLISNILGNLAERLESGENVWVGRNRHDEEVIAPEATLLLKAIESVSKTYERIVNAEDKAKHNLNIKQIQNVFIQFKTYMGSTCGICPVRAEVGENIKKIKLEPVKQIQEGA